MCLLLAVYLRGTSLLSGTGVCQFKGNVTKRATADARVQLRLDNCFKFGPAHSSTDGMQLTCQLYTGVPVFETGYELRKMQPGVQKKKEEIDL